MNFYNLNKSSPYDFHRYNVTEVLPMHFNRFFKPGACQQKCAWFLKNHLLFEFLYHSNLFAFLYMLRPS